MFTSRLAHGLLGLGSFGAGTGVGFLGGDDPPRLG
jgi:hypothetical protein